ncbi:MAG: hypothetical protein M5U12_09850 [Verrucomicrobia bacterium]|nr:hypothetical protein [Verrucomicrobiota bacterium]
MKPTSIRLSGFALLTAAWMSFVPTASAASPLVAFEFDEGSGTRVTDSVNSLSGALAIPPILQSS